MGITISFLVLGADQTFSLIYIKSFAPIEYLISICRWAIYYFGKVSIYDYNYLIPKLSASIIVPLGLYISIIILKKERFYALRPFKQEESIHGDADWAKESDIKKAGLRGKKGMLIGQDDYGFLVASGFQHALLFAPTGSGKGVGFVIPNLLYWEDSVFVHDINPNCT